MLLGLAALFSFINLTSMTDNVVSDNIGPNIRLPGDEIFFTVVMPVFNTAAYLKDSINSILYQSIGFKEHIQLILVDDGSTDESRILCLQYSQEYPQNILFLARNHSGVSAARNLGIEYVKGKYVNFLDSDDMWAPSAFETVYNFIQSQKQEVDLIGGRMQYFDRWAFFHPLDYKFTSTRIVDIRKEYTCLQLHVTSTFVRAAAIGQHRFNPKLQFGEDAQFLTSILLETCQLGLVKEAHHFYRRRDVNSGGSQLQQKVASLSYYVDTPQYSYTDLFNRSIERWGKVIKYVQYLFMYDCQYRINEPAQKYLTREEFSRYYETLTRQLQHVEDDVINAQKTLSSPFKRLCIWKNRHPHSTPDYLLLNFGGTRVVYTPHRLALAVCVLTPTTILLLSLCLYRRYRQKDSLSTILFLPCTLCVQPFIHKRQKLLYFAAPHNSHGDLTG